MKNRYFRKTALIVNVMIVILTFLEWNLNLKRYLITEPILRDLFSINKSPFELEF